MSKSYKQGLAINRTDKKIKAAQERKNKKSFNIKNLLIEDPDILDIDDLDDPPDTLEK